MVDVRRTYQEQYIVIEATPSGVAAGAGSDSDGLDGLLRDVRSFRAHVAETLGHWATRLDDWRKEGRRVAIWGAGSKATGFLTVLGVRDEVGCIVDINPGKQGYYQAGTAQRIVAPGYLREYRPEVVIVMNPIYMDEIMDDLGTMELAPEVMAL